jgi:hypothetical protein
MLEWKPIATTPANVDLEVSVYDKGEYHALIFLVGVMVQAGLMHAPIGAFCLSLRIGGRGRTSSVRFSQISKSAIGP